MIELFKLLGTIAIDNSGANNAIDDTTGKASKAEGAISKSFKKIGGAVATFFAIDKIKDFGQACVDAAVSISAETAAFGQIMGDYSETAQEKINAVADATGIVNSRLTGYMTSMTAKFQGLGYDINDATDMAQDGLTIAADAAAFWDKSMEDSMSSLNSFVNGNYEGGEAIGLFANETTLASWASENLGMTWKELSEKEKQFARLEFAKAMQETSGVVGQAANEAGAYANVQGNLTRLWQEFQNVIGQPILQNIVLPAMQKAQEVLPILSEKLQGFFDLFGGGEEKTNALKTAMESIFGSEAVETLTATFSSVKESFSPLIEAFKNLGSVIGEDAEGSTFFQDAFSVMANVISFAWSSIGQPVFDAITNAINWLSDNWGIISQNISTCFQIMWEYANNIWLNVGKPILDAISYAVGLLADYFAQKMSEILAFVQEAIAGIVDVWENNLKPAFEAIGNFLSTYLKPAFEFVFESIIKPLVDNTFGFIVKLWRDTLKPALEGIGDFLTGVFTGDWDKALNGIWKIVDGILKAIGNAFTSCMDFARDAVSNGINKIKGFFNFEWRLPDLKMPHFSISGEFSLNPLSVPSFGIDWYAKAMDNPMIMDSPTAFGINSLGQLMAGGEAGSEVVSGTDTLMNMISNAVASQNRGLIEVLYKILDAILALDENMGGNLREALNGTAFSVNNREFARLVKAVN